MNSAFGVDHGTTLREEYVKVTKHAVAGLVSTSKEAARLAATPKSVRLKRIQEAGKSAAKSTQKFGGPRNVEPHEFASRPAKIFRNKRKAWESGYYG
jgi:galactokinase